ncbi:MAG: hypothetical protein FVQ82_17660 [Planctomycetes bacterium]|nr:hypothetical protein [Planctomycetota bacterium]
MSDTVTEAAAEQKTDEAKTYSEEQFKGLLADKQSEVKKRQSIETELAELKAKQTQTPPAGDTAGDSEDAPMTVGQFKKLLTEERQTDSDARFALLEKETISEVKAKMTAETQGEGLDFDSVIAAGEANLSEGDKLAIRQSKNPAAEKYRRCVFNTPELSDKAEAVRTAKLLENVKLKGRVPGVGGNANTANAKDVSSMSAEELDQLADELE